MQNSVAKKLFAVGLAGATALMGLAPFAAHAAVHAAGTNVLETNGTVAMVGTDGTLRPYTSAGAFLSYGFNSFASTVTASPEDLALPQGAFIPPQDGSIICSDRGTDKGTCYFVSGGQKFGFTSAAVFTGLGFSFSHAKMGDVSWMSMGASLINSSSMAHLPGTLINKAGTVYLVGGNGLLGIPDLNTFNSWGYSFTNVVPANAADSAMSQTGVMTMRTAGMLSPSWTTGGNNNGGTVVNGSVSASLASDTPAANTLVSTASNPGQTGADLAHFMFTGTGTVTQVVVKRIGVSADTSVNNVYLYQGNTRITDAGSFSNGQVTFSNSNGLFTVSGSVTVSVRVDVASGVSGQTIGAQLASFTVANGSPVSTSLSGNLMSFAQVSNLATVAVTFASGSTGVTSSGATGGTAGTINAGTMNAQLWSAPISVGQRAVQMKYIQFKQIGSISPTAVQNLKLFIDGAASSANTASITNVGGNTNVVVFDLTGSPVTLNTGNHTIELHGDIVAGTSYNYNFTLQTATDVVFFDPTYGVNVPFTYSGGSNVIFQLAPGVTTINSGTITVQADPTFTPTQFIKNASQVTLGQWVMKAYGEDVKVQSLKVALNYTGLASSTVEGFNNLSIFVNGGQVGSSQSSLGTGSLGTSYSSATTTFGTTNLFTIPAGTSVTVSVKGDSTLNTNTNVSAVLANLVTPASSLQGVTSFNLSPSGDTTYTGKSLSLATSSVTLTSNSGYSNQTVSANVTKQKIGSYVIQASNADGVRVTSLTVGFPVGANNSINPTTTLAGLYIVTPQGSATPVAPQGSNNFSVNFTVAANTTATVDIYADVSNANGTIQTSLSGTGLGATSNQTVYLNSTGASGGSAVNGQVTTVGTGTLNTPTLSNASPYSSFVVSGAQNQPNATYNFVASNGGVTITKLYFMVATSSGATSVPVTAVTVGAVGSSPSVSSPVIYTGATPNGATSTITGLSIAVPTSLGGVDVPVSVNLANVGLNGIASNQVYTLKLTGYEITSGGSTTTTYINGVSANAMDLVGSYPTVTLSSSNSTLITGSVIVGSVTVSANAAGHVILDNLPISISANNATITSSSVLAIDSQSGVTAGTLGSFAVNSNSSATGTIAFSTDNDIAPGSPKTYNIQVTVASVGNSTNGTPSVSLSLGGAQLLTFKDVNGGLDNIPLKTGSTTYLVNYPTNTVSVHP